MKIKEWLMENKMQKLAFIIMFNIFYLFVGSYLVLSQSIIYETFAIGLYPLLIINIIVGIVIVKKGYYRKNLVHIFMGLIIVCGIISTIFAINPRIAVFGSILRYEGLISIMYYFSLMFIASFLGEKYKKIILLFILLTSSLECVYAILQIYSVPNIYTNYDVFGYTVDNISGNFNWNYEVWATGFSCNPNYFGTHMLLAISIAIGFALEGKKIKNYYIYYFLIALFLYGILISNTTSCAVGFCFVFFLTILYCIKNKKIKRLLVLMLICTSIILFAFFTNKTKLIKDLRKTGIQTIEIAKGNCEDSYGTNRIYIWKNGIKLIPNNLITGIGIDNFLVAFDGKALMSPSGKVAYDKLHNEYLQVLVTEGILCLIFYLIMYGLIIKNNLKNSKMYLILPMLGYMVQAFFNVSVIEIAPLFFVMLGMNIKNK